MKLIEKKQPAAKWRREDRLLICDFDTQMFDVHSANEKGHVSPESHQEVGPKKDGFVMMFFPYEFRSPQGRVPPIYWREYNDRYFKSKFRVELRYGFRADLTLFTEVTAALEEIGGPGSRLDQLE